MDSPRDFFVSQIEIPGRHLFESFSSIPIYPFFSQSFSHIFYGLIILRGIEEKNMEFIAKIVDLVNTFLWDYALLVLLLGAGIIFTFRLKFIQVRKFGEGMRSLFVSVLFRH